MPKDPTSSPAPISPEDFAKAGLDSYAPYLINRIARRYNGRVEADVREHGLNIPRLRVLAALAAEGPQSVNNLAVYAVSEQSTISRLLDQMEEEGLIRRGTHPEDNRSRINHLTDLGRQKYQDSFPLMLAAEADLMGGFSPAERSLALEFLRRMLDNIRHSPL